MAHGTSGVFLKSQISGKIAAEPCLHGQGDEVEVLSREGQLRLPFFLLILEGMGLKIGTISGCLRSRTQAPFSFQEKRPFNPVWKRTMQRQAQGPGRMVCRFNGRAASLMFCFAKGTPWRVFLIANRVSASRRSKLTNNLEQFARI